MLDQFKNQKQFLLDHLKETETLFETDSSGGPNQIKKRITELQEVIKEEEFSLVLLGEFSKGKSTLINALFGKNMLPTDVMETTAKITEITYADERETTIVFEDAETRELDRHDLDHLVTTIREEEEEDENSNEIKKVRVGVTNTLTENGIRIIDTPGVNDPSEHREEITTEIIPKSDAALFIMGAHQIFSRSEQEFLQERILDNNLSKIFFLINKVDQLDDVKSNLDRILKDARDKISGVVNDPKLYPISAQEALESSVNGDSSPFHETLFAEFKDDLEDFLMNERGKVFLTSKIDEFRDLLHDLQSNYQSRLDNMDKTLQEIENSIESVKEKLDETQEKGLKLQERIDQQVKELKHDLKQRWDDKRSSIIEALKGKLENWTKDDLESKSEVEKRFERNAIQVMKPYFEDQETEIEREMQALAEMIAKQMEEDFEELDESFANNFLSDEEDSTSLAKRDLSFSSTNLREIFSGEERGDQASASVGGGMLGGLGGLLLGEPLSGMILGALLGFFGTESIEKSRKELLDKIPEMITDHIDKIKTEIDDELNSTSDRFKDYVADHYNEKIQTITESLNQLKQDAEATEEEQEEMRETCDKWIDHCEKTLANLEDQRQQLN